MNWQQYLIGPIWSILGGLAITLYFDYDNDRMYHAIEKFRRFIATVFLFGLATGVFVLHLINTF